MSTNFYWKKLPKELESLKTKENYEMLMHIGKRSAGGLYCYECGSTLNSYGTNYIHSGDYSCWKTKCPICEAEVQTYVSTFTWTFMKQKKLIEAVIDSEENIIVDEYDKEYTAREFMEAIKSPVEYQMAGLWY